MSAKLKSQKKKTKGSGLKSYNKPKTKAKKKIVRK